MALERANHLPIPATDCQFEWDRTRCEDLPFPARQVRRGDGPVRFKEGARIPERGDDLAEAIGHGGHRRRHHPGDESGGAKARRMAAHVSGPRIPSTSNWCAACQSARADENTAAAAGVPGAAPSKTSIAST